MQTKSLYISSLESAAGSLIVTMGIMELLKGRLGRVAFFRPVIVDSHEPDQDISFILEHYALKIPYEKTYGYTVHQVESLIAENKYNEVLETLIEKFKESLSEAIVIATKQANKNDELRLVAYLVMLQGKTIPELSTLRDSLLESLPDYMIPSAFVMLDHIPVTANGKLDRKALPIPDFIDTGTKYQAPETECETLICRLFSELTNRSKVGVDDNFFSIGGHSLMAIELLMKIRQATNKEISLRSLFLHPTPIALAREIDATQDGDSDEIEAGSGTFEEDYEN